MQIGEEDASRRRGLGKASRNGGWARQSGRDERALQVVPPGWGAECMEASEPRLALRDQADCHPGPFGLKLLSE